MQNKTEIKLKQNKRNVSPTLFYSSFVSELRKCETKSLNKLKVGGVYLPIKS